METPAGLQFKPINIPYSNCISSLLGTEYDKFSLFVTKGLVVKLQKIMGRRGGNRKTLSQV